jgi:type VI secretion system secreted protein VgrG
MSTDDFGFAFETSDAATGPWKHLRVARLRGSEELGRIARYELTLFAKAPAPEIDPSDLVGVRATLRMRTLTDPPFRVVHGVVTEAEELESLPDGMLYRVVLAPPLARAAHRKRFRVFLDKTPREILAAVLESDPATKRADGATLEPDDGDATAYTPAKELYAFRVTDTSRLDSRAVRPYVVQYGESDLDFLARLLEEEGLSLHVEHGRGACLAVIADADAGRSRLEPFDPLGADVPGREIGDVKLGARMRPKAVVLGDYNWRKPALDMAATADEARPAPDGLFEYAWPGGYPDAPTQGTPLAKARAERYETEAEYAVAEGKARGLAAGSIFRLQHAKARYEGEYLVTKIEVRGYQEGVVSKAAVHAEAPYTCSLELARRGRSGAAAESRFRPAQRTKKPRIVGTQTAFVTADPTTTGAEIHVGGPAGGEIGCVRLQFHWDRDAARHAKEPTSAWVRVSQLFAGAGQGAVWHPRVGAEVIVDFEDGDPDRPIVTGRVYNGQNRPPWGPDSPTKSAIRSFTSPHDGKYNELSFEDRPGGEEMKQHAARNFTAEVGHDRSETVANDASSSVGVNRTESTGANRSTAVGANDSAVVGANASLAVGANHSVAVGVNQTVLVGASQSIEVGADGAASFGGSQTVVVGADHAATIGGSSTTTVGAARKATVGGEDAHTAAGPQSLHSDASQSLTAPAQTFSADGAQTLTSSLHTVIASAIASRTAGAIAATDAPVTIVTGDAVLVLTGATTILSGASLSMSYGAIALNGGSVDVHDDDVSVDGGGSIDMKAGVIKLN